MTENFDKKIEFKVFGLSIEYFSILFGLFLCLWGIGVSFIGDGVDELILNPKPL